MPQRDSGPQRGGGVEPPLEQQHTRRVPPVRTTGHLPNGVPLTGSAPGARPPARDGGAGNDGAAPARTPERVGGSPEDAQGGPGRIGGQLDLGGTSPTPADAPTRDLRPLDPAEAPTRVLRPVAPPRRRPPVDPPTEVIAPEPRRRVIPDDDRDYDRDHEPDEPDEPDEPADREPEAKAAAKRPKASVGSIVVRSFGELMVTAGLIVLLFVAYEVWITDLMSAQKQQTVTADLDRQWETAPAPDPQRQQKFEFADGEGIAKLYIPVFGPDYHFTIVEGTSEANLEVGPGHYKKSAAPGQPGNFAVAGHRVGKGAPFNDLDLLNPCDAVVVETQTDWYVYRMLPTAQQPVDPANPRCAGVAAQSGDYAAAVGRRIVTPGQNEVVNEVPGNESARVPDGELQSMLTLTTCHPKFSNAQRMIIHGVLVRAQPKADGALPPELSES